MNGIYTLFKDKKQELMIFATGHIYRETETAQEVETDDGLEWRVKWAQRGVKVSLLLALICFVARQYIVTAVFAAIWAIFVVMVHHLRFLWVGVAIGLEPASGRCWNKKTSSQSSGCSYRKASNSKIDFFA